MSKFAKMRRDVLEAFLEARAQSIESLREQLTDLRMEYAEALAELDERKMEISRELAQEVKAK